ncbi:Proteoglycan 4 [Symbiodinium microadriaticum]|uniref:Proteoglycan 4 n=1 Tax=Symbiodinium microadriaticum TaxID=2951 RepID=A0A1Q9DQA5_SYMMI|nr:Proteoglycan 4 [Symbiodinium microadriaticum]
MTVAGVPIPAARAGNDSDCDDEGFELGEEECEFEEDPCLDGQPLPPQTHDEDSTLIAPPIESVKEEKKEDAMIALERAPKLRRMGMQTGKLQGSVSSEPNGPEPSPKASEHPQSSQPVQKPAEDPQSIQPVLQATKDTQSLQPALQATEDMKPASKATDCGKSCAPDPKAPPKVHMPLQEMQASSVAPASGMSPPPPSPQTGIDNMETQPLEAWPHDRQPSFDHDSPPPPDPKPRKPKDPEPEKPKDPEPEMPKEPKPEKPKDPEPEKPKDPELEKPKESELEETEMESTHDEPQECESRKPKKSIPKEAPLVCVGSARKTRRRVRKLKRARKAPRSEPGPLKGAVAESAKDSKDDPVGKDFPSKPVCMEDMKPSLSPAEQSGKKQPACEEEEEQEEGDEAGMEDEEEEPQNEDEAEQVEEEEEEEDKPMKRPAAKTKPKAKAKTRASKEKECPKGKPKSKASAKGKAKAKGKNKVKVDLSSEEKAQKSRKSCAYHKAKRDAEAAGMSKTEANNIARQVLLLTWTQNINLEMQIQMTCVSYDSSYDPFGKSMNFLSPGLQNQLLAYEATIVMVLVCENMIYTRAFGECLLSLWDEERCLLVTHCELILKLLQLDNSGQHEETNRILALQQELAAYDGVDATGLPSGAAVHEPVKTGSFMINRYFKPNKKGALKCSEQVPTEEAFLFRSSEKQSCMQEGSVEVQVRLAGEMEPKTKELDLMNKSLLKFQTDAVLDAGTPPKRNFTKATPKAKAKTTKVFMVPVMLISGAWLEDLLDSKIKKITTWTSKLLRLNLQRVLLRWLSWCVKLEVVGVFYPVICPSTWMSFLLKEQSYLILGGIDVKEPHKWQALLCDFWQKYLLMDKAHVMHKYKSEATLSCTVPLYLHGDEGRGKYKLPVMVEAVQGVISWKDETLDALNHHLAQDLTDLFTKGIEEWYNMSPDARWRFSKGSTPFKVKKSPLVKVPGLGLASKALIDPAHTWHIG